MVKVKCRVCGDIGYTAAPRRGHCECGGRLKEITDDMRDRRSFRYNKWPAR